MFFEVSPNIVGWMVSGVFILTILVGLLLIILHSDNTVECINPKCRSNNLVTIEGTVVHCSECGKTFDVEHVIRAKYLKEKGD